MHADDWSAENGEFQCPPDVDNTSTSFGVPHPEPGKELRQDRVRADGSYDAFRIPMVRPAGQHGIFNPQPMRAFDADAYLVNFTARFLATRGGNVHHEAGCDCAFASARPTFVVNGKPASPGIEAKTGCPTDASFGVACSPACAKAFGLATIPEATCTP